MGRINTEQWICAFGLDIRIGATIFFVCDGIFIDYCRIARWREPSKTRDQVNRMFKIFYRWCRWCFLFYPLTITTRYNLTHCNLQMGSPIADYIEYTVVGFESFPLFPKEINSLYFVVLISFISMGFILGNCIQCTKSAIKVLCNCCLARSDVIMHLKVGMIWRNERRRSVLRQLHKRWAGWAWSGQVSIVSQVTPRWPLVVKATDYLRKICSFFF